METVSLTSLGVKLWKNCSVGFTVFTKLTATNH